MEGFNMGSFDDIFGGLGYPKQPPPKHKSTPKPEKGVPWEAKKIDGHYYVPLRQVADLLEVNGVLPKVAEGIRRRTS